MTSNPGLLLAKQSLSYSKESDKQPRGSHTPHRVSKEQHPPISQVHHPRDSEVFKIPFEIQTSNPVAVSSAETGRTPRSTATAIHSPTGNHYISGSPAINTQTHRDEPTVSTLMASVDAAHPEPRVVASENTAARYAAEPTQPNSAKASDFLVVKTPLRYAQWEAALKAANLLDQFADVVHGIKNGFDMGVPAKVHLTYTPKNHSSAYTNPSIIHEYISSERRAGRYTGPFSRSRLEALIGPFRSSPLGLVPKTNAPGKHRLIQDFSFPRHDPFLSSINDNINTDDFPCEWGTFAEVALLVINAPTGTEAATLDVDAAFRRVPIRPDQQPFFVISWEDLFYIDHTAPFGPSSSPGVFGHLADTLVALYKAKQIKPIKKWVDDFLFLRYPLLNSPPNVRQFTYGLSDITRFAETLGWPWKPTKTRPFATTFLYLGFLWNLETRSVEIPAEKRTRFLSKLEPWVQGAKVTRKQAESLLGTLVHCSLALPDSRSRLPAISNFVASFNKANSVFSQFTLPSGAAEDAAWWRHTLSSTPCRSPLHKPPQPTDLLFAVDASTSWGIGVVFDGKWDAWILLPGWKSEGRDIGWAEMVAVELGLRLAITQGAHDIHLILRSDNTGVIHALDGGRSRNLQQNRVLQRIVVLLRTHNLWLSTIYVPSRENPADPPSRGLPPASGSRIPTDLSAVLPYALQSLVALAPLSN
jgi:hypothetical protein